MTFQLAQLRVPLPHVHPFHFPFGVLDFSANVNVDWCGLLGPTEPLWGQAAGREENDRERTSAG